MDRQHRTKRLSDPKPVQIPLLGEPRPSRIPLSFTLDDVRMLKTKGEAYAFALRCSGHLEKTFPDDFSIDSGQWSCIKNGTKHFPHERENEFMDFCGNEIPLIWDCESRGYDFSSMRKHKTELEEKLEAANQRIAELEKKDEIRSQYIGEIFSKWAQRK